MSMYVSETDFTSYHQLIGENCDFTSMRTEMASFFPNLSVDASSLADGLSWLDVFSIDFAGIFDSGLP